MSEHKMVYEPSKTTHWKNLFPSKMLLLGSQNLNDGEELIAEIASVAIQAIKNQQGQEEHVPVLQFVNAPPMVLNITNTRAVASLYGEQYDRWTGCFIQIYATKVKAFGQEQMALRVREARPNVPVNLEAYENTLRGCTTMEQLQQAFMGMPKHLKQQLTAVKDEMKGVISENS